MEAEQEHKALAALYVSSQEVDRHGAGAAHISVRLPTSDYPNLDVPEGTPRGTFLQ